MDAFLRSRQAKRATAATAAPAAATAAAATAETPRPAAAAPAPATGPADAPAAAVRTAVSGGLTATAAAVRTTVSGGPTSAFAPGTELDLSEVACRVLEQQASDAQASTAGKHILAFLGATGAGKTTTLLFLSGAQLELREETFFVGSSREVRQVIAAKQPNEDFAIGKGNVSTTKVPRLLFCEGLQRFMVDLAGLLRCYAFFFLFRLVPT
jgi:hypothetical protein